MSATVPFKRLILRAVLRGVSPMGRPVVGVERQTEDTFVVLLAVDRTAQHDFAIAHDDFNVFSIHRESV